MKNDFNKSDSERCQKISEIKELEKGAWQCPRKTESSSPVKPLAVWVTAGESSVSCVEERRGAAPATPHLPRLTASPPHLQLLALG